MKRNRLIIAFIFLLLSVIFASLIKENYSDDSSCYLDYLKYNIRSCERNTFYKRKWRYHGFPANL